MSSPRQFDIQSFLHGAAYLGLIVAALYWQLLCGQYIWFDHPDGISQVLPWLKEQVRAWASGHFPLWDPYHYGGQSLIGQVQPAVAYPLNILFCLAAAHTGGLTYWHLNIYYVVLHYAAALCAYFLCFTLGLGLAPSLLGGLVFSCSGYVGTSNWPQMLNSALWLPAIFTHAMPRADGSRNVTNSIYAGGFLGLALLGGHHQIPTYAAYAAVLIVFLATYWQPLLSKLGTDRGVQRCSH